MARANEFDRYKYGVCTNRDKGGKPCPKCESKEVQKIRMGQDFVCEECKESMRQVPPPKSPTLSGKVIGIIAGAVVILGGAVAYFSLSSKKPPKVEKLELNIYSQELFVEDSDTLTVTNIPADSKVTYLWLSDNEAVVTVNNGVVFLKSEGKASITVKTQENELVSASCRYTVKVKESVEVPPSAEVKVESIILDKTNIEMTIGDSDVLNITLIPEGAKAKNMEWNSKNEEIATVENGIVTAIGKGQTTISLKDAEGATASCVVKVTGKSEQANGGQNSYGKWTGGAKNGKLDGVQIRFIFTSTHQIDNRDPKKRIANVGDYIIGEYQNGNLIHGTWYKKTGGIESVIIGE